MSLPTTALPRSPYGPGFAVAPCPASSRTDPDGFAAATAEWRLRLASAAHALLDLHTGDRAEELRLRGSGEVLVSPRDHWTLHPVPGAAGGYAWVHPSGRTLDDQDVAGVTLAGDDPRRVEYSKVAAERPLPACPTSGNVEADLADATPWSDGSSLDARGYVTYCGECDRSVPLVSTFVEGGGADAWAVTEHDVRGRLLGYGS